MPWRAIFPPTDGRATRPTLFNQIATRAQLVETVSDLFGAFGSGAFRVDAPHSYPLSKASRAHAALEARTTTGASILLPD